VQPPILVINPRSDASFVGFVENLTANPETSLDEFQRTLRERYPAALVRERDLSGERRSTWYVYREGAWIPNESS
jgi:hypothetical protein